MTFMTFTEAFLIIISTMIKSRLIILGKKIGGEGDSLLGLLEGNKVNTI